MNKPFLPCPRCGHNIAQNPSHADTCLGRVRRRVDIYRPRPYHPKPTKIDDIDELDVQEGMTEMTVGIGFKCDDGIVLAADTQHSGALKLRGEKVFQIAGTPGIKVCVAGAGTVSLIRKAVEKIGKSIASVGSTIDMLETIEEVLTKIHQKHIYPYQGIEDNRPSLQLLVGIWTNKDGCCLIDTEQTVPNVVKDYAVTGSGGTIAEYIIRTSQGYLNTVNDAKYLAAYAVAMAKTYDLFCGKETRIKTLSQDGTISTPSSNEIKDWETFFEELLEANQVVISGMNIDLLEDEDLDSILVNQKERLIKFRDKERQRRRH